jgi:hypothetical protein
MDKSASGRTRMLKARTLAVFHKRNPDASEYGGSAKPMDALTHLLGKVGTAYEDPKTCDLCCSPICDLEIALFVPPYLTDIPLTEDQLFEITDVPFTIPAPPIGYTNDYLLLLFFPDICNASNIAVSASLDSSPVALTVHKFAGPYNTPAFIFPKTYFYVIYPAADVSSGIFDLTVSASNACSSTSTVAQFGCFLEGAPVHMADGTTKAIQDVRVGDVVLGAFGEHNPVLALHRPLLGAGHMIRINDEHNTTSHHPHVAADRTFYAADPERITGMTYGKKHTVILADGSKELRTMTGLAPGRVKKLAVGTELQTISGARAVTSLAEVPMSPFTQVYHMVVGGSHTYIVEGYAVTAWPREDDFDFDSWTAR